MEFLKLCGGMFSIVSMVLLGMLVTHLKWVTEEAKDFIINLAINVSLPALMFKNIITNFTRDEILNLRYSIIFPAVSILLTLLIGILTAKIFKIPKGKHGLFVSMFFNSNTIFVGLPVNLALNGEKCIPYVMLYYMASTIIFWTLGVYFIGQDSKTSQPEKLISIKNLKNVVSLPLMGFLAAIICVMLQLKFPSWVMDSVTYVSNLTTPLSMIFIGSCIYSTSLKNVKFDRSVIGVLVGRFLVAPCIMIFLLHLRTVDTLLGQTFVIQAAMPVMTNTAILARAYNCDEDYAAVMTVLTTAFCMLVVPVYYLAMG